MNGRRNRLSSVMLGATLAACATLCFLWTRSVRRQDILFLASPTGTYSCSLSTFPHKLMFTMTESFGLRLKLPKHAVSCYSVEVTDDLLWIWPLWESTLKGYRGLGFGFCWDTQRDHYFGIIGTPQPESGAHETYIWVPLWVPVAITLLFPTYTTIHSRRQRERYKKGLCVDCGYDLRETLDRCPECGTVPTTTPTRQLKATV